MTREKLNCADPGNSAAKMTGDLAFGGQFQPDLPPPANTVGFVGWMRKNLFNGPVNSIVTALNGS